MKRQTRVTFRDTLENTRRPAAEAAWRRASVASSLRHLVAGKRDHVGSVLLEQVKLEALQLAAALLPEEIRVTIDDDFQVGLLSVRWQGHGRFHLPANVAFGAGMAAVAVTA